MDLVLIYLSYYILPGTRGHCKRKSLKYAVDSLWLWKENYLFFFFSFLSLIDATHKDVDVLLLLSNSAYYVA